MQMLNKIIAPAIAAGFASALLRPGPAAARPSPRLTVVGRRRQRSGREEGRSGEGRRQKAAELARSVEAVKPADAAKSAD